MLIYINNTSSCKLHLTKIILSQIEWSVKNGGCQKKNVDSTEILSETSKSPLNVCPKYYFAAHRGDRKILIGALLHRKNWKTRIRLQQTTRKATHCNAKGWKRCSGPKATDNFLGEAPGMTSGARGTCHHQNIRNRKSIFAQGKRKQVIKVDFKYKCTSIQMNKSGVATRNFVARGSTWMTRVFPLYSMFQCIL